MTRECNCGSGLDSWPVNDARGIYVARVCEKCEEQKLSGYRRDIFTNANYECDECVDPDAEVNQFDRIDW